MSALIEKTLIQVQEVMAYFANQLSIEQVPQELIDLINEISNSAQLLQKLQINEKEVLPPLMLISFNSRQAHTLLQSLCLPLYQSLKEVNLSPQIDEGQLVNVLKRAISFMVALNEQRCLKDFPKFTTISILDSPLMNTNTSELRFSLS